MLTTKREWTTILESVEERFYDNASDVRREAFTNFCKKKFPNAGASPVTIDDMQTYVYLMLEFAYAEQGLH